MNFNAQVLATMHAATNLLQAEGPTAATATIQRALNDLSNPGMPSSQPHQAPSMRDINPAPAAQQHVRRSELSDVLQRFSQKYHARQQNFDTDASVVETVQDAAQNPDNNGKFISGSFTCDAGTRAYKLYIPSAYSENKDRTLSLVVMLHGCKQNPDDFAAGTQMNRVAEENSCFVLYPAQTQNANGSNCWNWFRSQDQQRGRGEPSLIAGMTREIMRTYRVDPRRVYVAGLSAGGAMAAIMGQTYPDLFAAIGIHSGLAHGAAHDMPSAFGAMKNGMPASRSEHSQFTSAQQRIPVIVFHGDRDQTVHPRNGDQALAQCTVESATGNSESNRLATKTESGQTESGHSYTKVTKFDDSGNPVAEQWTIHGAGHAWSGGSRKGSYTDVQGPDASREMMRFFHLHTNVVENLSA